MVAVLQGVPHGPIGAHPVGVAPTLAESFQVAGIDEFAHDPLGGAFGDTHPLGHVPESKARVPGDAHQRVGVVRQERSLGHTKSLLMRPGFARHAARSIVELRTAIQEV